jgi:hypothetical protein
MMNPARGFLLFIALAGSGVVSAAPRDNLVAASIGTWKGTSPDGRIQALVTYEDRGDGFIVATIRTPDQTGNLIVTNYYAMKIDGKEYPLSARNQKGIGSIVHRVADEDTLEYDIKVDGEVTTRGTRTFSKNRQTMTLASRDGSRPPQVLQKQN